LCYLKYATQVSNRKSWQISNQTITVYVVHNIRAKAVCEHIIQGTGPFRTVNDLGRDGILAF